MIQRLFLTAAVLWLWAGAVWMQAVPQEPDENAICDNSHAKDSAKHFHNCDCVRSTEECSPEHPKSKPQYGCKTYCREDHCDCATPSCS